MQRAGSETRVHRRERGRDRGRNHGRNHRHRDGTRDRRHRRRPRERLRCLAERLRTTWHHGDNHDQAPGPYLQDHTAREGRTRRR